MFTSVKCKNSKEMEHKIFKILGDFKLRRLTIDEATDALSCLHGIVKVERKCSKNFDLATEVLNQKIINLRTELRTHMIINSRSMPVKQLIANDIKNIRTTIKYLKGSK